MQFSVDKKGAHVRMNGEEVLVSRYWKFWLELLLVWSHEGRELEELNVMVRVRCLK